MLAERLNEVALDVHSYAKSTGLVDQSLRIGELLSSIQPTEQGPGQQQHRQQELNQLRSALGEFYETLDQAPSNQFAPSEVRVLQRIGGWRLTGARLRAQLEELLNQSSLEVVSLSSEYGKILNDVHAFYDALGELIDVFGTLGVQRSTLPTGERAEIGGMFPIQEREDRFEDLIARFDEFETHLRFFSEVTGSTPAEVRVRAISTSSWEVFLGTPYATAAAIAFAINQSLTIIQKALDIAERWRSLRDSGTPTEITDEKIEEEVQSYTEKQRNQTADELLELYPEDDEGRRREIRTGLRNAMKYLIQSIQEGCEFEVRVIPPTSEEEDEEIEPGLGNLRAMKERGRAMADESDMKKLAGRGLRLIESEGSETNDDEDEDSDSDDAEV